MFGSVLQSFQKCKGYNLHNRKKLGAGRCGVELFLQKGENEGTFRCGEKEKCEFLKFLRKRC
jgi:hypothetical protein